MLLSLQNSGLRSLQMLLAPVHNLHTSRRVGLHPALPSRPSLEGPGWRDGYNSTVLEGRQQNVTCRAHIED